MDPSNIVDGSSMVKHIFDGGLTGVVAVLILAISFLLYDRKRLITEISDKEDKLEKVTEDYYKGTITISEAFNSLNVILTELKSKL